MKKVLFLLFVMCFLILPAKSEVLQTGKQINLEEKMLNTKFIGYEIDLQNTGKNPVKIISVDVKNLVNNSNQILVSEALQGIKKNNKYIYLDILTFGISGFVGNAKNNKILTNQKAAIAEAATFETTLENLKGEVLLPNRNKTFRVLIPIDEKPNVEAIFQDVKTNQYITSKVKE